jgi:hypothetical protein
MTNHHYICSYNHKSSVLLTMFHTSQDRWKTKYQWSLQQLKETDNSSNLHHVGNLTGRVFNCTPSCCICKYSSIAFWPCPHFRCLIMMQIQETTLHVGILLNTLQVSSLLLLTHLIGYFPQRGLLNASNETLH